MVRINNLPAVLKKNSIGEKLTEVCRGNDVVFLAIFGSFVKGRQKKTSDIDVAIEFDKNKSKDLLDLIHLERELKKTFGRKVDASIFDSISPYIMGDVKKEMRIIYDQR